jgi:SAM-dependent methyltransferase
MPISHPFLNPSTRFSNSNVYVIRKGILEALKQNLCHLNGTLLDIGCGQSPYKPLLLSEGSHISEYIGLDLEENPTHKNNPDLLWDGSSIPLKDDSVDSILLTEVLEHVPEPIVLLKESKRVLKKGGKLFGTVPFLYPLHEIPFDFFRYTPFAIEKFAKETSFEIIKLESHGGWNASLALMIGLWTRQSRIKPIERLIISLILRPVYYYLLWREKVSNPSDFHFDSMLTGLFFIFKKN